MSSEPPGVGAGSKTRGGPVLIEMQDGSAPATPDTAPPIPEIDGDPGQAPAMARAARLMARRGGRGGGLARIFWIIAAALMTLILSLAAWDWVMRLMERVPLLGLIAAVLTVSLVVILLIAALREGLAFVRLSRLDSLQREAAEAITNADLALARDLAARLERLYAGREDLRWQVARLHDLSAEQFDADALLALAETTLMAPLDAQAQAEVENAARQVATVTAVVPIALADVVAALTSNLRMIRRVAEIYGGRAGTLGVWRLTRTVMTHLVATGAVAVGDDLIGSVAGGSILSKLSRRFGEGVVNGALTARVGVAAMEVCRPLPFRARERPLVTTILRRAVSGLFDRG